MLRGLLLVISGALFAAALIASLAIGGMWPAAILSGLVFAGIAFERIRYRPIDPARPAGAGWRRTEERFVDPASGALVEVWYDAASGARRYVAADEQAPRPDLPETWRKGG